MPDYKEMYIALFQSVTKAINTLQGAQQHTEEMYISTEPPDIKVLDMSELKKENEHKNGEGHSAK